MVVVVHIGLQLERLGYGTYSVGWLSSGVDIFFVISGFIMWVSVERRRTMTAAEFMRARLIRIVPLYWLVSAFVLATCLIAPQLLHTTVLEWKHALASFLFLPARHPVMTQEFWPLLIPGWTLNYEMLFYVLFAVAIAGSGGSARIRFGLNRTIDRRDGPGGHPAHGQDRCDAFLRQPDPVRIPRRDRGGDPLHEGQYAKIVGLAGPDHGWLFPAAVRPWCRVRAQRHQSHRYDDDRFGGIVPAHNPPAGPQSGRRRLLFALPDACDHACDAQPLLGVRAYGHWALLLSRLPGWRFR